MAKAFDARFNDAWASEQFEQYSDDVEVNTFSINEEDQYDDCCSVVAYFEHHPEFGVCENSAKEVVMGVNIIG